MGDVKTDKLIKYIAYNATIIGFDDRIMRHLIIREFGEGFSALLGVLIRSDLLGSQNKLLRGLCW